MPLASLSKISNTLFREVTCSSILRVCSNHQFQLPTDFGQLHVAAHHFPDPGTIDENRLLSYSAGRFLCRDSRGQLKCRGTLCCSYKINFPPEVYDGHSFYLPGGAFSFQGRHCNRYRMSLLAKSQAIQNRSGFRGYIVNLVCTMTIDRPCFSTSIKKAESMADCSGAVSLKARRFPANAAPRLRRLLNPNNGAVLPRPGNCIHLAEPGNHCQGGSDLAGRELHRASHNGADISANLLGESHGFVLRAGQKYNGLPRDLILSQVLHRLLSAFRRIKTPMAISTVLSPLNSTHGLAS